MSLHIFFIPQGHTYIVNMINQTGYGSLEMVVIFSLGKHGLFIFEIGFQLDLNNCESLR